MFFHYTKSTFIFETLKKLILPSLVLLFFAGHLVSNNYFQKEEVHLSVAEKNYVYSSPIIVHELLSREIGVIPKELPTLPFLFFALLWLFIYFLKKSFYYFVHQQPILENRSKYNFVGSLSPPQKV